MGSVDIYTVGDYLKPYMTEMKKYLEECQIKHDNLKERNEKLSPLFSKGYLFEEDWLDASMAR